MKGDALAYPSLLSDYTECPSEKMVRFNSDPGEAESHLRLTDIDDDEKDPCETTRSQHKLPLRTIIALTCGSAG